MRHASRYTVIWLEATNCCNYSIKSLPLLFPGGWAVNRVNQHNPAELPFDKPFFSFYRRKLLVSYWHLYTSMLPLNRVLAWVRFVFTDPHHEQEVGDRWMILIYISAAVNPRLLFVPQKHQILGFWEESGAKLILIAQFGCAIPKECNIKPHHTSLNEFDTTCSSSQHFQKAWGAKLSVWWWAGWALGTAHIEIEFLMQFEWASTGFNRILFSVWFSCMKQEKILCLQMNLSFNAEQRFHPNIISFLSFSPESIPGEARRRLWMSHLHHIGHH